MAEPSPPTAAVSRVSIRVPPFWPNDPELWFAQLEGQFLIHQISNDNTKYGYVIGNLEARYAAEVKDIIVSPPSADKYNKLKTELIARLSMSQERKIRQLLEKEEVGDRKPSKFLRALRDLGGNEVTDSLLRTLWMGRLPQHIQAIVASQPETSLDAAAVLADRVLEVVPAGQVSEVRSQQSSSPTLNASASGSGDLASLCLLVTNMQLQLNELQKQNYVAHNSNNTNKNNRNYNRRSRSYSRARSQSRGGNNAPDIDGKETFCYYHRRFGTNARRCRDPCSFQAGNEEGQH